MKLKKLTAALLSTAIVLTAVAIPSGKKLPCTQTELYVSAADYVYEYDIHVHVSGDFKYRIAYRVTPIITDEGKKEVRTPEFVFITDYTGKDPNVVIPSEIDGLPVGEIYDSAFDSKTIESVVIPDTVKTIGIDAFNQCDSLTDVQIGSGVETFGGIDTFFSCDALEKIVIPDNVKTLSVGMFRQCDNLRDVTIGKGVKSIPQSAFNSCGAIKNIVIPENVEKIDSAAFADCHGLESIVIENPDCEIYDNYDTICHSATYSTFEGTIYGHKDSTAQAHAEKYNKNFALIEDIPPATTIPITTVTTTTTKAATTTTTKAATTTTKATTTTTKAATTTTKATTTTTKATTTTTKATTTTTKAITITTKAATTTTKAATTTTTKAATTTKATTTQATATTAKPVSTTETETIPEPPPLISYDSDEWWSGEIVLDKDTVIEGNLVLGRREVIVNGTVTEKIDFERLDLNGYTLTVKGNLIQGRGSIKTNGGTLNVGGDYSMQDVRFTDNGYIFEGCGASLECKEESARINIGGDFSAHNLDYSWSGVVWFTDGVMTIGGDFWADKAFRLSRYDSKGKIIFKGDKDISVYNGADDAVADLEEFIIENPGKRIITYGGNIIRADKVSDMNIKSAGLRLVQLNVSGNNIYIDGDVTLYVAEDITIKDGGTLTITGDFNDDGNFRIYDGTLNVGGNLCIDNFTSLSNYGGQFEMLSENSVVNIKGDFTADKAWANSFIGTTTVGGNISIDRSLNFGRYGNEHQLILNSSGPQTIQVRDDGTYGRINKLVLTKPLSNYTFEPSIEDCCECIVMSDCPDKPFIIKTKTDLNGDGKINSADIVALQKLLLGMDGNKNITTIVDLNDDGKMNVFDMIILKRMVLKSS